MSRLYIQNNTIQVRLRDRGFFYAENGIWYDAVAAITKDYLNNPQDKLSAYYLRFLLRQVGLSDVMSKEVQPIIFPASTKLYPDQCILVIPSAKVGWKI